MHDVDACRSPFFAANMNRSRPRAKRNPIRCRTAHPFHFDFSPDKLHSVSNHACPAVRNPFFLLNAIEPTSFLPIHCPHRFLALRRESQVVTYACAAARRTPSRALIRMRECLAWRRRHGLKFAGVTPVCKSTSAAAPWERDEVLGGALWTAVAEERVRAASSTSRGPRCSGTRRALRRVTRSTNGENNGGGSSGVL